MDIISLSQSWTATGDMIDTFKRRIPNASKFQTAEKKIVEIHSKI